ncbi:TPA: NusG domain II-containing protein [Clostridium botulinum]|uniref:NusG domain II-containing protein n=1 Tax=Clostridium botulinum TaxID=1491 RepID=UPI000D0CE2AE|nr:NusG domain II-containing protein [Clostridium botulinum]PSM03718.1 NusG domain II-containing protein [Clostridium botulinum]HDK7139991.1 NusG domain II-containing protein [Clostridium botulinum]HDK7143579.1 NusG domain II-containing protein [Clostridium botulinum]HDK7147225.1 NusG domain II-containing protein [Clostridium botulinum]HDK7149537.1 NusG domain II-containing protein [Clostridium botulinum]
MKKGDKIVIYIVSVLLVLSVISIIFFKFFVKSENAVAVIKQNGKIIEKVDLSKVKEKRQLKINYNDKDHKGYNIIEIDKGSIRFIDADCPDKVCIKSGVLKKPGETAACLPHKLIITIEKNDKEVDEVSY